MSDVYYPIDVTAKSPETFSGSIIAGTLNRISISRFSANAQSATRHKSSGRNGETDDFAIVIPTHCREHFEHFGCEGDVAPGEIVIFNSAEKYSMDIPDHTQNITLKIPSECLRDLYPAVDQACGHQNAGNSKFVPIVAQFALQSLELAPLYSTDLVARMENSLLELIYLMLDTPDGAVESTSQSLSDFIFQQLLNFIANHFQNPELTPLHAAQQSRISVRYLHKIFQSHGTTFGNALLRARLGHAKKLLGEKPHGRSGVRTIAEIAYTSGFSSQSHFSVRYKDEFGLTPREARASA